MNRKPIIFLLCLAALLVFTLTAAAESTAVTADFDADPAAALALLRAAFLLGHFAAAIAHFPVQLGLEADDLVLGLENGFFLFLFSPVRRVRQERIGVFFRTPDLLFDHVLPVDKAGDNARGQSDQDQDNCQNRWHG